MVDGAIDQEGRVEVCINGVWGSVCSTDWDDTDAFVICKQLGYGDAGNMHPTLHGSDGEVVPNHFIPFYQNQLCIQTLSMERERDPLSFPMWSVKDGNAA